MTDEDKTNYEQDRREKVLRSIRQLLAGANSSSTDETQAEQMAKLAHALCARYHVDAVELLGERPPEIIEMKMLENYDEHWRRILGKHTADLFFCRYLTQATTRAGRGGKVQKAMNHCFYGRVHNVVVAMEMSRYLIDTVNRLANEAAHGRTNDRVKYILSFRSGCATRVCQRLQERKKETSRAETQLQLEGNTTGITNLPALQSAYEREEQLNDDYIAANIGTPASRKSRPHVRSSDGIMDGLKAGDTVSLDPQLKQAAKTAKLPSHSPAGARVAGAAARLLGKRT